jgi:hypothetical protein
MSSPRTCAMQFEFTLWAARMSRRSPARRLMVYCAALVLCVSHALQEKTRWSYVSFSLAGDRCAQCGQFSDDLVPGPCLCQLRG